MIYTVTFNPTLDYALFLPTLQPGAVNRAARDSLRPGGKGINVSIMLSRLGENNLALGFVAGFTGGAFLDMVQDAGVEADFLPLPDGTTRINVILKTDADSETEINSNGPDIPAAALEALLSRLDTLGEGDTLVLAGSIPPSMPQDVYEQILGRLEGRGIRFVVDATGDLLLRVLPHRPFLLKPNIHELGALFGRELSGFGEATSYARRLQGMGAENVLVSMGSEGAVLVSERGDTLHSAPPKGKVVGAVGSGDSMVAGFLAGYSRTGSYEKAFRLGLACGSASAFTEWLATREEVAALLDDPLAYKL